MKLSNRTKAWRLSAAMATTALCAHCGGAPDEQATRDEQAWGDNGGEHGNVTPKAPQNFHEVLTQGGSPQGLYRGGHAKDAEVAYLKTLGVKYVVTLEAEPRWNDFQSWAEEIFTGDTQANEKRRVEKAGMTFLAEGFHPMSEPAADLDKKLEAITTILGDASKRPLFFHCTLGIDRTGLVAAAHRMVNEGWKPVDAFREWKSLGYAGRCGFFKPLDEGFNRVVDKLKTEHPKDTAYDFQIDPANCDAQ